MAVPKKAKVIIDTLPIKVGNDYLKYGMDRIEELMRATDTKTKYLPKTILLEDLDQALFDYVESEKLDVVIDGNKLFAIYLESDRWGEFSKTWKLMDNDKNVSTPYITVRRLNKQAGTRLGTKYRVPQPRKFLYLSVPILDDGQVVYLHFKMPEPVNVDLIYEVALFTKFREDVNRYDEQILKNFASRQEYITVKGNPMPLLFEGFAESNTIENIDGDRFYVSKYALKVQGFIQDEKDFDIVKTTRKPIFGYYLIP